MKARFIRSEAMSERLGETPEIIIEAEWFQLTYDGLRAAPDGNHIAHYSAFEDVWRHNAVEYSDVVLYTEVTSLDNGRDVRDEQLRRRLGDDEYEYLRMEAKIDAEESR